VRPSGRRLPLTPLAAAARSARQRAHAPYSRFKVGAAVLADAAIHAGCNVENASYGLTICAERNAVSAAVLAGAKSVDALVVVSATSPPTPPCGMCLQTLAEFGEATMPIILVGKGEERVETTLGALLPRAFSKAFL
jgi:cytidine deaminase